MFVFLSACHHRAEIWKDRDTRKKCKRHPTRTQRKWNSFDNKKEAKTKIQIQTKDAKLLAVCRARGISCAVHAIHFVPRLLCATSLYEKQ